jgi:hypothetical protein
MRQRYWLEVPCEKFNCGCHLYENEIIPYVLATNMELNHMPKREDSNYLAHLA